MISWAVPCAKKGDLCHPTQQVAACRNFMQISGVLAAFSAAIMSLRRTGLVVLRNKGVEIKAGLKMILRFKELLGWIIFFAVYPPSPSRHTEGFSEGPIHPSFPCVSQPRPGYNHVDSWGSAACESWTVDFGL